MQGGTYRLCFQVCVERSVFVMDNKKCSNRSESDRENGVSIQYGVALDYSSVLRVEKGHIGGNSKPKERRVMSNAMEFSLRFESRDRRRPKHLFRAQHKQVTLQRVNIGHVEKDLRLCRRWGLGCGCGWGEVFRKKRKHRAQFVNYIATAFRVVVVYPPNFFR